MMRLQPLQSASLVRASCLNSPEGFGMRHLKVDYLNAISIDKVLLTIYKMKVAAHASILGGNERGWGATPGGGIGRCAGWRGRDRS